MTPAAALVTALLAALIAAEDPLAGTAERIERHRKGDATVVVRSGGQPVAGAKVVLEQKSHAFLFGCNIFALDPRDGREPQRLYRERYKALLNYATLPFYWGAYERERGKPGEAHLRAMAEWCRANGIAVKGHPVVWHEVFPGWVGADEPIEPLLKKRIAETVGGFKGLVDRWDVVNESLVAPQHANPYGAWVKRVGPAAAVESCLRWAAEVNPAGFLLVNDFKVSPEYEAELAALRERRAPFHAVGIQSHMHGGEWTLERAWKVCESYARIGLPLHFTELTVLSGPKESPMGDWHRHRPDWRSTPEEEARQADYVEGLYTLLFSHPAVEAITWWDFSDAASWMGAPAGFLRKDMSPKPIYERLLAKVKGAWWTARAEAATAADGSASLRGFLGIYDVTVTAPSGAKAPRTLELRRGETARLEVEL
ncbi:MAG: endo-1,4-beta-xylanase [Planctomycetes bacterium]|nr:endo-1,4-beta-xylanase [Planctomycetota bacterium]